MISHDITQYEAQINAKETGIGNGIAFFCGGLRLWSIFQYNEQKRNCWLAKGTSLYNQCVLREIIF